MTSAADPRPRRATPGGGEEAIALTRVSRSFGSVPAVRGLSLTVARGETVALLGPNGAGKTTTIAMLLGLLEPDGGTVCLFGGAPRAAVAAGRVGAILQDGALMPGVRVGELLEMLAGLFAAPLPVERVMAMAQLHGLEGRRVDRLSGGQLQRARLAAALIGDPDLLLLDEPTAAMDVESRRAFWRTMDDEAARGRTIVFSTHHLEEADRHAERVVVIGAGRLLADGSPAAVKASVGHTVIRLRSPGVGIGELEGLPGVVTAQVRGDRVEIRSADADATVPALFAQRWEVRGLEVGSVPLEDAFVALTAGAGVAATEVPA